MHGKCVFKAFSVLSISFTIAITPALAWEKYVDCNNGALIIDFQTFSDANHNTTYAQYVIRNRGVVEYFKRKLPNLGMCDQPNAGSIFHSNGELIFSTNRSQTNPHYQQNPYKASYSSQIEFLDPLSVQSTHYMVRGSRMGKGVWMEFYEERFPGNDYVIADWYFENCTRLNADHSTYDPLEFSNALK